MKIGRDPVVQRMVGGGKLGAAFSHLLVPFIHRKVFQDLTRDLKLQCQTLYTMVFFLFAHIHLFSNSVSKLGTVRL